MGTLGCDNILHCKNNHCAHLCPEFTFPVCLLWHGWEEEDLLDLLSSTKPMRCWWDQNYIKFYPLIFIVGKAVPNVTWSHTLRFVCVCMWLVIYFNVICNVQCHMHSLSFSELFFSCCVCECMFGSLQSSFTKKITNHMLPVCFCYIQDTNVLLSVTFIFLYSWK